MELKIPIPKALVAMATASLLLVLYHVVSCVTLPDGLLTSRAIGEVCHPTVWPAASNSQRRRMLKSLFWLRQAVWALLASLVIAVAGLSAAVLLMEVPKTSGYDYYKDWLPFKDKESSGNYEPLELSLGQAHVVAAATTLAAQLLVAYVWNAAAMNWFPFPSDRRQVAPETNEEETANGPNKSLVDRLVSSRSQAQRNLFLVVLGLQMIPVLGAGHLLGWALVVAVWFFTCVLFAVALLVQDSPAGFEALQGSPVFGMVILASDLAEMLRANLDAEESESSQEDEDSVKSFVEPSSCCSDGAHSAGCKTCQQRLRRFPATLVRMTEALVVSYRWQPVTQALVHPNGCTGLARCAGMKDGIVGLNMSRWQRQQLLATIESSPCPYVWLDALSMPAAILGPNPDPGSWLLGLSDTLLTRMMAVYAAGAITVVLRSSEPDGGRYHERAWTMQEFCGSRAITVCSESGVNHPSYTPEEAVEFLGMRRDIQSGMKSALPLWGQRLLESASAGSSKDVEDRKEAHIRGVEAFVKAQAKVTSQEPVDKVRALLPILFNSPVQDAAELRDLSVMGAMIALDSDMLEEAKTVMIESQKLVTTNGRYKGILF
jgi:hypothetical protein